MKNLLSYRNSSIISKFFSSLRVQLVSSIILLVILIATCSNFFFYKTTSNILTRNYKENSFEQFHQLAYNLGYMIKEAEKIIMLFGSNSMLQIFLDNPELEYSDEVQSANNIFKLANGYFFYYPYIASIYCYSDNNTIIGVDAPGNVLLRNYQASDSGKAALAYGSDTLKAINSRPNELVCLGNLTEQNFMYYSNKKNNEYYLTIAKSLTQPLVVKHKVTVLVNIREDAFRSAYNDISNTNSLTYIISSKGKIVSHPDTLQINEASPTFTFRREEEYGDSGSFISQEGSMQKQVIYYKISGTDFYLVRETPLNMIIKNSTELKRLSAITISLSIILTIALSMFFIRKITRPLLALTYSMRQIEKGELEQIIKDIPNNEIGILNRQFNRMSASIKELTKKNIAIEEEKHNMEIEALQAQINPHFLFNTLNTLKWMASISNAKRVAEGLTSLGNLLRPLYCNIGVMWTIREEYEFIQNYLKLMNYRYGGKCNISFNFQEEVMDSMVLTFILQPILENSFFHGLENQNTLGEISIAAFVREDSVFFELKDNGIGIDEEKLSQIRQSLETDRNIYGKKGIGISNVSRRIQLHFGSRFGISIESTPGSGTTVFVRIPNIKKNTEELNNTLISEKENQDVQSADC